MSIIKKAIRILFLGHYRPTESKQDALKVLVQYLLLGWMILNRKQVQKISNKFFYNVGYTFGSIKIALEGEDEIEEYLRTTTDEDIRAEWFFQKITRDFPELDLIRRRCYAETCVEQITMEPLTLLCENDYAELIDTLNQHMSQADVDEMWLGQRPQINGYDFGHDYADE